MMKITRRTFGSLAAAAAAALAAPRPGRADAHAASGVIRAHGESLIGDLKYPADFPHFDFVNPDAPKGGAARLATASTFDSLNPFITKGKPAIGASLPYDSLMTASLDEGSTMYGLLVEWMEYPEDFSWVSYQMRPEARWHDGAPLTAADVIWSFETLTQRGAPFYRQYWSNVVSAEDLGEGVIRFTFDQTGNRELPHIVGQLPVLPKHYWESRDFEESTLEPPLGSGPYRFGRLEPGRFIEYERVAEYWGADLPVNRGLNNFDTIRYDVFLEQTATLEAFKSGAVDYRWENSASRWANGYDFPAVRRGDVVLETMDLDGPESVQLFAYNLRLPKFQDRRVREALSLAYDFEWTNKVVFYEQYARPWSFFQGTPDLMPEGAPTGRELALLERHRGAVPEEVFGAPYAPPVTDGSGRNRSGLRRARALLEEAGWSVVDGALTNEAGEIFTIDYLGQTASTSTGKLVEPIFKNLETLGIKAQLIAVDGPQYVRRLVQSAPPEFEMITWSVANSESPGNEQRGFWSSAAADTLGSRNVMGVKDPVVDALIDEIIFAEDREALSAACRALDRVLTWNHYGGTFQLYAPLERFAYWDRFGRPDPLPPRAIGFPSVWWWDAEKAAALENGE